jgi:periplasmic protein TonB
MATSTVLAPSSKQHFLGWVPRTETHGVRLAPPVRGARSYTDLSESLLAANLMGAPSRKRTLMTSIMLHTLLVGIPLLLSVWFTNTLDIQNYTRTLLVAPPAAPSAPPPPSMAASQPAKPTHRVFTSGGKLFMPPAIPKRIAMVKEEPLAPEPETGGVFGGVPGGVTGGAIGGILEGIKAPEAPAPPRPVVETAKAPVPVGGNVRPPRIIFRVAPEYPVLAHQAGIQGEVIISAVIDSKGNVADMKIVSGPALLYEAAMKALAQWKFEPTYLNGEPVAIRWNAIVNFRIGTMNGAS